MRIINYCDENDSSIEIFLNKKEEITIKVKYEDDYDNEIRLVSFPLEEIESLIIDLQKLVEELKHD